MKGGNPRTPPSSWNFKTKKRCIHCRKRAKDEIEGTQLCRIHSPIRKGFATASKIENDKRKKIKGRI